ncbi:Acg family FMN-binding oxidoreductase [Mycolicibacterium sp. XJ1819]
MPERELDTDVIKAAVQRACRAPSLHNSQPWRWVADGDAVELYLDKDRVLYATDRSGREAVISCGAVLDHFRVAMAAAGWTAEIHRYPNPNNRLHLATIHFEPADFVTEGQRRRAEAMAQRRTDRLPFAEPPDWETFEAQLRHTITGDTVRVDVVSDDLRVELTQASQLTESLRRYDTSYHAELSWWTRELRRTEGIPYSALTSPRERARVDVSRDFPARVDTDRRVGLDVDQSKVVVLSTYDDTPASALRCGEMLSAVLLDATMAGLATCPLTHITELQSSRDIVASLIEQSTTPQVLVRVGVAPDSDDAPEFTPRRPIDDVFEIKGTP